MAIYFDEATKTFYLEGKNISYVFYINKRGFAEHLYYGRRIARDCIFYTKASGAASRTATVPGCDNVPGIRSYDMCPAELSFFGTGDYREPTVEVLNPEGDRLTELLYESHEIVNEKPRIKGMPSLDGGETLIVHLKDSVTEFAADMYYTVYDDCSVIARRIVYKNCSERVIRLNRAYSFAMALPGIDYDMLSLYGAWAKERLQDRIPLHRGVVSIDSKRVSSSDVLNPFMGILERGATETVGEAYGFNLVYSSSYVLKAEGRPDGTLHLTGGINDFDFSWKLDAGEELETPEIVIAYSDCGIGGMSRALHDAYRNHLINKRFVKQRRPVVINHWEGTTFHFNNEKLIAIADAVKGMGIDTFVMDDGWFGVRNGDNTGLGDWFVNTDKLEGGLTTIIDHVHSIGMNFGLWFEPEMISEDSDIFRAHPDYAIGVPNRPRCYSRHQFMMDITRADVRDYIVNSVNNILHNNRIEYVKWDFNRNATEMFSLKLPSDRQSEFAHRYALGLYELCERIVEANPKIFFEGCSAGGGRYDPAMLYYFPQIWTSDNSDGEERTLIQYGTSIVYPPSTMSCHVSKSPNKHTMRPVSIKARGNVAAMGTFGYELDATHMTEDELSAVPQQIEEYRTCEDLLLDGDLYRIDNPVYSNFFSFMMVAKDKSRATLTVYRRMHRQGDAIKRIKAVGLDPEKRYKVRELNGVFSGKTLMSVGIVPAFDRGDFSTVKYHFDEE